MRPGTSMCCLTPQTTVFTPETGFVIPERTTERGRGPHRARPDRAPHAIDVVVAEPGQRQLVDVAVGDGPDATEVILRFAFVRARAGNRVGGRVPWPPNKEWLIAEWPPDSPTPTGYSDLQPARGHPTRAAGAPGAAALPKIELDST